MIKTTDWFVIRSFLNQLIDEARSSPADSQEAIVPKFPLYQLKEHLAEMEPVGDYLYFGLMVEHGLPWQDDNPETFHVVLIRADSQYEAQRKLEAMVGEWKLTAHHPTLRIYGEASFIEERHLAGHGTVITTI